MNIFEINQFLQEIKIRDSELIDKLYYKYGKENTTRQKYTYV